MSRKNRNEQFVPTKAILPKESPEKRLRIGWQLEELIEGTIPDNRFRIPTDTDEIFGFTFGSISQTGRIDPRFLFGFLESERLTVDIDHPQPEAMVSLTFFTRPGKLDELISGFREQYVFIHDVTSRKDIPVYFNDPFNGGMSYIPITGGVDLSVKAPRLYEMIDRDPISTAPLFEQFTLRRIFVLDKSKSEYENLDPDHEYTLGP